MRLRLWKKLPRRQPALFLLLLTVLLLAACAAPTPASLPATSAPASPTPEPTSLPASPTPDLATPPTRPFEPALATPSSTEPAAGICMEPEGDTAVVEIFPDIPSPRCLKVTADQHLLVINRSDSEVSLSLGALAATIPPGEEQTLDRPFGEYLAPGVHWLQVTPYFGPEVWLVGD